MTPEQKFAMQMERLTPEYQQRFFNELHAFFAETIFPKDSLPALIDKYRFASLIHCTEQQLQITTNNFLALLMNKSIEEYSVGNIIAICKGAEKTTLIDWIHVYGNTEAAAKDYADYRTSMSMLTELVNEIINPQKDSLVRKMESIQRLELQTGRKQIALS